MNQAASMWNYVKNYKFNSLFVRNFLLIIIMSVLPLGGISISVYSYYNAITKEEISKSNMNDIYKTRDIVDMIMLEIERLSFRIAADPEIETFLQHEKPEKMDYATIKIVERVQNILSVLNSSPNYIDSIIVYSEKNGYVITSAKELNTEWRGLDLSWKDSYMKNMDRNNWYANISFQKDTVWYRYVSSFRKAPLHNWDKSGAVIINIDEKKLGEIINSKDGDKRLYITDNNRKLIYNSDKNEGLAAQDVNMIMGNLQSGESQTFIDKSKGVSEVVSIVNSKSTGFSFVSVMPLEKYEERLVHLKKYIVNTMIINILLAVIVSFIITIRVFNPIKKIMEAVSDPLSVAAGEKAADSPKKIANEFNYIVTNISSSYIEKAQMKAELAHRQELLEKAQSIALQSQINPHFLYNTLENINWKVMGLTGGINEGSEMISLLSHLLRLSLETENYLIPIGEEMEHARLYVEIQKKRYDDKFDVEWEIDEGLLQCMIVKISVQPIVENAIYHGLKPLVGKGLIRIKAFEDTEEGTIMIQVMDNGVGLSKEQIYRINDDMKNDYIKENRHIGMINVNQRIRLSFGEQYGLSVRNNEPQGTIVTMRLPRIYQS